MADPEKLEGDHETLFDAMPVGIFQAMWDATPMGVFFYDEQANIRYINPAGVALLGRPEGEIKGHGWIQTVHPDDIDRLAAEISAAIAEGHGFSGHGRLLHPDGTVVWCEATAAPVPVSAEQRGFVTIVQDVTERKVVEGALKDSQTLLRAVMDGSPSAVTVKSTDGRFLFVNEQASAGLGIPQQEILGRTLWDVLPANLAQENERKDRIVLESGTASRHDEAYVRDGQRVVLSVLRFPILNEAGALTALCVVATDVTDRLNAEEARLRERQKLAVEIHDDSVQVMASVALRIEALVAEAADNTQRERLLSLARDVRDSVGRLRSMMFELGSNVLEEEGLVPALDEMLARIQQQHSISCSIETVGDPPLSPGLRSTMFRIAREAVSNAVKHSGASNIDVEIGEDRDGVHLCVSDDGRGFDTTAEAPEGHIGISTMRARAVSAGGTIEVVSRPGLGTTVDTWLPLGVVAGARS